MDAYEDYYPAKPSAPEPDLLSLIVKERQNGADSKLVSDEEAAGEPEEYLLLARAVAFDEETKAVPAPDPANFKALPEARKTELKKEVHTFLRRVENKYGKMNEIFRTPCSTTPELCKEHEVSGLPDHDHPERRWSSASNTWRKVAALYHRFQSAGRRRQTARPGRTR